MLDFTINIARAADIHTHLSACDTQFVKILKDRVDLAEYSQKLVEKATLIEAWDKELLVGLVAGYHNNPESDKKAYITNVSVLSKWQRQGVAKSLMQRFIKHVENDRCCSIDLEVVIENHDAQQLYCKLGFFVVARDMQKMKMKLNLGG